MPGQPSSRVALSLMLPSMVATFLGAFLLFQVQPLLASCMLPWFGGSAAVWTTTLLFFQTVLVAGYAYAHLLPLLPYRAQVFLHGVLLCGSLLLLPILPDAAGSAEGDPSVRVLLLLTASVGLPSLLLASTSPLVQRWFVETFHGRSPYRLYALSNAASLAALLSYPFVFQPSLSLEAQSELWEWVYLGYGVAICSCGVVWLNAGAGQRGSTQRKQQRCTLRQLVRWTGFSAAGSATLLAVSNKITQDIAAIPFLWVMPLALYLGTFIWTFEYGKTYRRSIWAAIVFITALSLGMALVGVQLRFYQETGLLALLLVSTCMICHGELFRSKPQPDVLTSFYLAVAVGGALGGVCVAVLAPKLLTVPLELGIAVTASVLLLMWTVYHEPGNALFGGRRPRVWVLLTLGVWCLSLSLGGREILSVLGTRETSRSFFGVLSVRDITYPDGTRARHLSHGRIRHGSQLLDSPKTPTCYYGFDSGIGLAIQTLKRNHEALNIGVVGLGAGTLAVYGRPRDSMTFYELDPDVGTLARAHFSYLADSRAELSIVYGDARTNLGARSDAEPRFDLLVLDAFSGDAIPIHLLTLEALEIYSRHLADDGILAIHISNFHVDLRPVVAAGADARGWTHRTIRHPGEETGALESHWMLLGRNGGPIDDSDIEAAGTHWDGMRLLWTDHHASILPLLN